MTSHEIISHDLEELMMVDNASGLGSEDRIKRDYLIEVLKKAEPSREALTLTILDKYLKYCRNPEKDFIKILVDTGLGRDKTMLAEMPWNQKEDFDGSWYD